MNKIYVLDTNVLLLDPHSLLAFEDRDVIVPLKVIEELDRKKTMTGEIGYNARETFRILKNLKKDGEDLWHGVKSEKGGIIRIEKADREVKEKHNFYFDGVSADVEIIQTALTVQVNMGNAESYPRNKRHCHAAYSRGAWTFYRKLSKRQAFR